MRSDIKSYHLGGMGCAMGVVAVGLINELLAANPNAIALFVPAEITSAAFYGGDEANRMVANTIFR
jgi:3-ketoacyl-CoA synthase